MSAVPTSKKKKFKTINLYLTTRGLTLGKKKRNERKKKGMKRKKYDDVTKYIDNDTSYLIKKKKEDEYHCKFLKWRYHTLKRN